MRYAFLSLPRSLFLIGLIVVLLSATFFTFTMKGNVYGSTPFFTAVRLFFEGQVIYGLFAMRHYGNKAAAFTLGSFSEADIARETERKALAIPVLTYHRLEVTGDSANVTIANFMDQMQTLYENGWRTATLPEYEAFMSGEIELPEKTFLITFDDGAQQSFYPTDPVLKTLGFTAVQYIIIVPSEAEGSSYYLSRAQIEYMLKTGRWEIGSHSFDAHRPYIANVEGETGIFYSDKLWLPKEGRLETNEEFTVRVYNDLKSSKEHLEQVYGVPIRTFAFPFGGEAGLPSVHNFPEGEDITVQEAKKLYDLGWLQTERKEYTFNYPDDTDFLHIRIHVDFDWDGERLLRVMENGIPKTLPFSDTMAEDRGWLTSWGEVQTGGVLYLKAKPNETSASSLLDGSRLWSTYESDAIVNWQTGYVFLLGEAMHSKTYRSCVFADGEVQIQDTIDGETTSVKKTTNASITYGNDLRLGMRVSENSIACLYQGRVVLESGEVSHRGGGVGIQTWDSIPGNAELTITKFFVVER